MFQLKRCKLHRVLEMPASTIRIANHFGTGWGLFLQLPGARSASSRCKMFVDAQERANRGIFEFSPFSRNFQRRHLI